MKLTPGFSVQEQFVPFGKTGSGRILTFFTDRWNEKVRKEDNAMAKERFVEVYSQGITNVEKIIVDTQTGVNYILASSAMTAGCGMSVLVDADGKPIVTPVS